MRALIAMLLVAVLRSSWRTDFVIGTDPHGRRPNQPAPLSDLFDYPIKLTATGPANQKPGQRFSAARLHRQECARHPVHGRPANPRARPHEHSAAIYAHISADVEGKSLGVQRQLEDCRELAADRGWPVGAEYVDNDVSAFSGKPRREYAKMLADLGSGARDAVVVYNLDRFHRRPVELEEFVALCERAEVSQVATVTADIDLGNDDGLFMARIFAAFAAKESGRQSQRVRRKLWQNAEQGLPHGSVRPFGYEDDKITLRESEAVVVREMVDRYLAGQSRPVAGMHRTDTHHQALRRPGQPTLRHSARLPTRPHPI